MKRPIGSELDDPAITRLLDCTGYRIHCSNHAGYKIIVFAEDSNGLGGTRLRGSARDGTHQSNRVSANLLRWHLRICIYHNMKANAEPQSLWEEDLGEDNMGQILEQQDAAERMEVELFTRLGGFVA
ncbi:hypothetical protein N7467_006484 [Penicillium canescens]|nr:hypothetical protein N7467_006484 [Penicillium canescens]